MSSGDSTTYTLLYQAGLANVFDGQPIRPRRVLQSDFRSAEMFCRGLREAGIRVNVRNWNGAGDALLFRDQWSDGAGDIFAESKHFA